MGSFINEAFNKLTGLDRRAVNINPHEQEPMEYAEAQPTSEQTFGVSHELEVAEVNNLDEKL
jgi:hypothetical protein